MKREEMIEEIKKKKECHLVEIVEDLVSRAMTKDEDISGKYLEKENVELKEKGIGSKAYNYYFVTNRNFVRIYASENEYWYKVCPLNRFTGIEEKNFADWGGIAVDDIDTFAKAGFPGKMQVNIYFDVADEGLPQVRLESKEDNERREADKKEIKKFVSALMTAVSGLRRE